MSQTIENQLNYAIEKCCKFGVSKHGMKKADKAARERGEPGVLTGTEIWSDKDKKQLKSMSKQLGKYIKENYPELKLAKDINIIVANEFLRSIDVRRSWRSMETAESVLNKLSRVCEVAFKEYSAKGWQGATAPKRYNKDDKKLLRVIPMDKEHVELFRKEAAEGTSKAGLGFEIALRLGVRAEPISDLRRCDIDLVNRYVRLIDDKGKKNYSVPIRDRHFYFFKDLFFQGSLTDRLVPILPNSYCKQIQRWAEKNGIKKYAEHKTSNHALRKTVAQDVYNDYRFGKFDGALLEKDLLYRDLEKYRENEHVLEKDLQNLERAKLIRELYKEHPERIKEFEKEREKDPGYQRDYMREHTRVDTVRFTNKYLGHEWDRGEYDLHKYVADIK